MANKKISDMTRHQPNDEWYVEAAELGVDNYKLKLADVKAYVKPPVQEVIQEIDSEFGHDDWHSGKIGIDGVNIGTVVEATDIEFPQGSVRADHVNPKKAVVTFPDNKMTPTMIRTDLESLNGDDRLDSSAIKAIPCSTGEEVVTALEGLTGNDRLDASAIKNIPSTVAMTGTEIIHAIVNDPNEPKLPADDIENLTGTQYIETDSAINIVPIDKTYIEVAFEHAGDVTQTMPNLVNCRDGLRFMVRNSKPDGSLVTLVPANSGQSIDGIRTYEIDSGNSVLFIAMTKRNSWHVEVLFNHSQPILTSGIEVDDGVSNVASVHKINTVGMKIVEMPNQGGMGDNEVKVASGLNIHMTAPNQQYGNALCSELLIEPPLKTDDTPSGEFTAKLYIDHAAYEPMHSPSFLAYLTEDTEILGKSQQTPIDAHRKGALWFDNIVQPSGAFIETSRVLKKYGIQESDNLDPNVTGGTDYLVIFRSHMKGYAPEDGFVRAYLYNASIDPYEPTGYLTDKNGDLMVYEKKYKEGEELGVIEVAGIVNAKGLQEFSCHAIDSFSADTVILTDRTEGCTGLLIQALTSESKTGDGLQQFELDTAQNIEFSSHYLGEDRMNLTMIKNFIGGVKDYTAGTNAVSADGWHCINYNGMKMGLMDDHVHFEDDGTHICDFNFGKVFSAEETQMLRGKDVEVEVTLTDKYDAYNVSLMKWTGTPDKYTPEIYSGRNNDALIMQANWTEAFKMFITENPADGDHTLRHTFVVPDDANNYGIVIYPIQAQEPIQLKMKEFKVDVTPAFTGYILHAPELANEIHLHNDKKYMEIVADNLGYASFRYTINNTPAGLPMPVGKITKGAADIEIDRSVNQVSGSSDHRYEGAIKFNADGAAKISTDILIWSEKNAAVTSNVNFWWSRVSDDGNSFTKIPASELNTTIKGGEKSLNSMGSFTIDVEQGQRIALFASSNLPDGAFIESTNPRNPMVSTTINFEELSGDISDDPALITDNYERKFVVDNRVIPFNNVTGQNFSFSIDIPDDVLIGSHSVVGEIGGNRVSMDGSEFSYDSSTKTMIVHVGSATEGNIYLTLWG